MITEKAVKERYAAASKTPEAALCCPVSYDQKYLEAIPQEVIEKDYGCGDPSKHLLAGETVLDLGSGTGKICFIASQVVGPTGKVIGVDMTDDMLEVARRNAPIVAERIGHANVEFRKGRIQDLGLDLEALEGQLQRHPVSDLASWMALSQMEEELRLKQPLVATESVDVVVSNCVLNLVDNKSRRQLFAEISRVLKVGGRAVISDIVSDEEVPGHLQQDATLWSGCISGAFTEEGFLQAFADAGFYGIEVLQFDSQPWQTVEGIEFRSMTVQAFKGGDGPCLERNQAVIYRGPFQQVVDDGGQAMERGVRYAVCDKTYQLYRRAPYASSFIFVEPATTIEKADASLFDCSLTVRRPPRETKRQAAGQESAGPTAASPCCGEGCC